jgi:hypothetical protein
VILLTERTSYQKDRRNEEKTMNVDENVFFREATLRICSSLDLVTALKRCFEYIRRALSLQKNGAGFDCRSLYHRINIALKTPPRVIFTRLCL